MAPMAENFIAACSKTRPPMLEKGMYDSWKTRIMLYIRGKENGEMLRDSVKNGPYKFKSKITIKDTNGVTDIHRAQRLEYLVGDDNLRYDSDIKSINILLLGLPIDIYTRINHYQTAKEIWDRFTSEPGESIHSYNLRFAKLINDMNMIPMSMTPIVTFDQLFAFLKHNERDAKEVREMRQRFPKPLALLANTYNPPHSYKSNQTHYAPTVVQQPPTFQPDTGLAILTFLPTDDPIASLNKAMIFLSLVYHSKFPPTNNQLRTSSNPRTQDTIQNGQVMVQNVQGRQSQGYAGNARNNQASRARVINTVGNTWENQPRVVRCYNCNGEGHMAKQCIARKRVKDSEWFKEKMLLSQAQEAGVVLDEERQVFLADSLEETDEYCDDEATANAIFMENLSHVGSLNDDTVAPRYDSDTLSEVPHYDTYHDSDVLNSNIQELGYIENIISNNDSYDELKGNRGVISYTGYMLTIENDEDNYVPPPVQKNDMILNLNKARDLLTKFDECIKRRTTLSPHEIGIWEQSNIKGDFKADVIPFSQNLKETFKLFEKGFIAEVKEMKDIFEQMEDEVDQCSVAKKSFEIKKKQLLINNDRLLEENIASDIMCIYLRSLNEVDNCGKCKSHDIVLLDLQELNKSLCELRKHFAKLEEYKITLDIAFQNHKEQIILNEPETKNKQLLVKTINNQSVEINDLKVKLQDKSHVINKLKHLLAQKSQKTQCESPVFDSRIQKIENENVSLSFQVSSLVKEREHNKLEYKKLYDSIKQTRAKTKLQTDSLQQKLND
ncbi:reverse transcriptase domain-containing protein [Tanacetum coccineum]|uniref:Reverse transcriptase domain-containing protein n=1 Tax=Tanacetum coccineum TaxID=301880 RepID=A0ABQ5IMY6_9ASTR